MEEYLRRVQIKLGAGVSEDHIHAVLGGPEPDVDSVAATLCLALHLSQEATGGVCVPLLCSKPRDNVLPEETTRYLQRVKISESLLLWKEDVDLQQLHHTGKLSLTLLRDGLLDSSEYHNVEPSILRVVHQDAGNDGTLSAVTTVTREILQEAAEHVRGTLRDVLREALQLQREALWVKHGFHSEELEELERSLEVLGAVTTDQHAKAEQQDLMQRLSVDLKEFSDGETTIGLTSLTTEKEDWHSYLDGLKSLSYQHGFSGLVLLLSISDAVHPPRQQVAVYSTNTVLLNQICTELEDSSSWSLAGELDETECLQIYHIPINTSSFSGTPPLLEEEICGLLKYFVNRRSSVLACHPSSRTSSTEGVAGSVEFSQGSSGINDMDGSDTERADGSNGDAVAIARVAEGEEDTGAAGINSGGELLSPDSGMTTIRSSRSSKESSVFLSDDSPVGEALTGASQVPGPGGFFFRNPSPLSSLTPPVPPERRKHRYSRNKSDNFEPFSIDPSHSAEHPTPAEGAPVNSRGGESLRRAGSSSLSELDELSLLDFSAPNSLVGFETGNFSMDQQGQFHGQEMIDTMVPPTPVNSLVGSRPPSSCGVRFFPEDVVERINGLQHKDSVSSSLSETWDELSFDSQGPMSSTDNSAWNRLKDSSSPLNIVDSVSNMGDKTSKEDALKAENIHQKAKTLEPQLSLITEHNELCENWNQEAALNAQWNPVTLADLQLTPPEEEVAGKYRSMISAQKQASSSMRTKTPVLNNLTPDTSREEDDVIHGKKREQQAELLDFWAYSAQKGFLKSDSGTTTSYPESLSMWNTTIRDDSLSPLTTPENLSENSGSFCGLGSNLGLETTAESPVQYSDGGMEMWNTTIQEESSSNTTTPEGPDNGKDPEHVEPALTESLEMNADEQGENYNKIEDTGVCKTVSHWPEESDWRSNEHNVKIVIEAADGVANNENMLNVQNLWSGSAATETGSHQYKDETLSHQNMDVWDLPVCGIVTSTSEYDNIGAGALSSTSSADNYPSPVVDLIQLDDQSSPFIDVTKPNLMQNQHQTDEEKTSKQVFLFDTEQNLNQVDGGLDETDSFPHSSEHSPFVLVDNASTSHCVSQSQETQIQQSTGDWFSLNDNNDFESSLSQLSIKLTHYEDGSDTENKKRTDNNESSNEKLLEVLSLSPSPGYERDVMISPDNLQTACQEKLRSSSDGESSSGLEMEYIVVPGSVKEVKEWTDRPEQNDEPTTLMKPFSMTSMSHDEVLQPIRGAESTDENRPGSTSDYQNILDDSMEEIISLTQSKPNSPAFQPSNSKPTEEVSYENESSSATRSVSPSLRPPSDHFLRTMEEVYVRSQISMEDSDEGGMSPPNTSSLVQFKVWSGHLVTQDTSQPASDPQSPVLSNSSVSPTSSHVASPTNESSISNEKGLGLPFSGDLMEEECDEEEFNEEAYVDDGSLSKWTPEEQKEDGRGDFGSTDLLSFSDVPVGGSSLQTSEPNWEQHPEDYYNRQTMMKGDCEKWSTEHPSEDQEASRDIYSPDLRYQDTSRHSSQSTNENAAYKWTGNENTTQGQTTYGYNYHHIDQRTENQCTHPACADTKPDIGRENAAEVYAEFTSDAGDLQYSSKQTEEYYEAESNTQYSLGDSSSKCHYAAETQYLHDSMQASELQYSQHQTDSRSQYESETAAHQYDEREFYQPETEDHPHYGPEGYVHFLLSRHSQQGGGMSGRMMKMGSSEETAEEPNNREDPPSSADTSAGSNQRRKLAAPPLSVSLDHSDGSLPSEDALDTDDDALDTGDDLDVNIDDIDTPDEADSLDFNLHVESGESTDAGAASAEVFSDQPSATVRRDVGPWRTVLIGEQEHRIDMKCIEPYKRVLSHGGYYAEKNAIIVFAACFLPDSDCDNYNYVMENLFLYVISTLELMVADDYMIVYLNGATPRRRMPGFTWMKRCYQMIDRRLKKNLKLFIIVHPSWFIRTLLGITRPFISSKFSSKIKYVHSLRELGEIIPMEYVHIPPTIVKVDKGSSAV